MDQCCHNCHRGKAVKSATRGHDRRGGWVGLLDLCCPGLVGHGHCGPERDGIGGVTVDGSARDEEGNAERLDAGLLALGGGRAHVPLRHRRLDATGMVWGPARLRGGAALPSGVSPLRSRLALDECHGEGFVVGHPLCEHVGGRGQADHSVAGLHQREPLQFPSLLGLCADVRHILRHLHVPGLAGASHLRGHRNRHLLQRRAPGLDLRPGPRLGHLRVFRHEACLHRCSAEVDRRGLFHQRSREATCGCAHPLHARHRRDLEGARNHSRQDLPPRRRSRLACGSALRHPPPPALADPGLHLTCPRAKRLSLRALRGAPSGAECGYEQSGEPRLSGGLPRRRRRLAVRDRPPRLLLRARGPRKGLCRALGTSAQRRSVVGIRCEGRG
mmetsp:Transcript_123721/g.263774  ORF Transcript_123721/g.263774 Transcript_123721/m.263774 type:complete len:387 (-) Transcript_123721:463-1623(-)